MIIHGNAVTLCPLDRRHMDVTRQWANDRELARLLDRARPVGEMDHEDWFANHTRGDDRVYFAIESKPEGVHVGNIWLWGIDPRHRKAEVRIVLGSREGQGRGMGTEALSLISDYARERLNLRRLYAYVLGINPRARRAFEKAGFTLEGVLREDRWVDDRYVDVFILGKMCDAAAKCA